MCDIILKGEISHMFNNCPKPNGWFGCFFKPNHKPSVTLIGTTNISLRDGMRLQVRCHEENRQGRIEYHVDELQVLTSGYAATVKYLSGPDFPGIGASTAESIYFTFRDESLDIIEYNPDRLKSLGISDDKIKVLHNGVCNHNISNQLRKIMPWAKTKFINELIADYEDKIITELKKNPYILYSDYNIPFVKADGVAEILGIAPDSDCRIHACIYHEFKQITDSTKDVFLNLSDDNIWRRLVYNTVNYINRPTVTPSRVSDEIKNVNNLITCNEYGTYQLYDTNMYDAECLCIDILSKLLSSNSLISATNKQINRYIDEYEKHNNTLDNNQRQAVIKAMQNRVSIINGGPGRGKTTVIKCILYVWQKLHGLFSEVPILSAPTGRAVKRMRESIGNPNYNYNTVAYFVTKDFFSNKKKSEYMHNLMIIDESSMLSLENASEMLCLGQHCQVVFVGDVDQLPSIQPGSFFRDICSLDFMPITTLTTCYRTNTHLITDNADKINNGALTKELKYDPDIFMLYPQLNDDQNYVNTIIDIYRQHLHDGIDFNEICVLAPMRKYLTGVNNLNIRLQELLNPEQIGNSIQRSTEVVYNKRGCPIPNTRYSGVDKEFTKLRVGDKAMYTENRKNVHWYDTYSGETGTGIFNGDCGIITEYHIPDNDEDEPYLSFKTDDGKLYQIDESDFENLQLAYAMTIHKSQGCEYDIVIMSAQCALKNMPDTTDFASRNLIYTGITRAKNAVEIVGSADSLNRCISTLPHPRNSLLYEKLTDKLNELINANE